jgi:hypothetical protein
MSLSDPWKFWCAWSTLQKLNQFSQRNNVLDAASPNVVGFPWRDTCVCSYQLNTPIWSYRAYLQLEHQSCRKYSFHNLTQFSQGNNVLDAAASNIEGLLWRGEVHVSSIQANRPIRSKQSQSLQETHKLQEVLLSKTNLILTGKQCARWSCF